MGFWGNVVMPLGGLAQTWLTRKVRRQVEKHLDQQYDKVANRTAELYSTVSGYSLFPKGEARDRLAARVQDRLAKRAKVTSSDRPHVSTSVAIGKGEIEQMPYRSKKTYRKRRTFRKRGKRASVTRSSLVRTVRKIQYSVAEEKFVDFSRLNPITGTVVGTKMGFETWYFMSLINAVPQGNTESQRIGNKIYVKYIDVSVFWFTDGTVDLPNGATIRMVVVRNKDTNATIVTETDLFSATDPNTGGTDTRALRNFKTMSKYTMLKDVCHDIQQNTDGVNPLNTYTPSGCTQFRIPVSKRITYITIASDVKLASALLSDDYDIGFCTDTNNNIQVGVSWRVVFTDQ